MSSEPPRFGIWTWGSCRHSHVVVLHPRRFSLGEVTGRHGEHIVDLGFMTIKYTNNDSRKNLNRRIEVVEVRSPVVIRNYGASSCNPSSRFDRIYLLMPPNNVTELEVRERVEERMVERESKTVRVTELIRYVEVPDVGAIEIDRKTLRVDTVEYKKYVLKVYVIKSPGKTVIELNGDTFPIKDKLKELGYKWDSLDKVWKKIVHNDYINVEIERLKGIDNVEVTVM
ncbi:MAG: hypothetical protein C0179_02535 [Fervidicoccus sp.]|nr:MAG: hypothetical protein C0179_02535 [Fervidicoccus sp.]